MAQIKNQMDLDVVPSILERVGRQSPQVPWRKTTQPTRFRFQPFAYGLLNEQSGVYG